MDEPTCLGGGEHPQSDVFEAKSPATTWAAEAAKHALDDLFTATLAYRKGHAYFKLMQFVAHFRFYSPYNAMLLHVQRPGATYVAPAYRWKRDFKRSVKPNANPLVILQPMGPVMFVFDVADTLANPGAPPLPAEVTTPFEVRKGTIGSELDRTIENAKRDGVRVWATKTGSQGAGHIQAASGDQKPQAFAAGKDQQGRPLIEFVPVRYAVALGEDLSHEARYVTLLHELGHLYCGHIGTLNPRWWPDRRGIARVPAEFEAESVAYLVSARLGIDNPSESYLSNYVEQKSEVPAISLECVMKAAGLIETMARGALKPRPRTGAGS